jgi:hypothetical protein
MSEPQLQSVPNPPKPALYPSSGPFVIECQDGLKVTLSDNPSAEHWECIWAKEMRWVQNRLSRQFERQIDTLGLNEQVSKVFAELAITVEGLVTLSGEEFDATTDPSWTNQIHPNVKYRILNGVDFWNEEKSQTVVGGIIITAVVELSDRTVSVKHILRNPTDSEKSQFDRKTAPRTSRDGVRTNKGLMNESVKLYDRLIQKHKGYEGEPPDHHKRFTIRAMMEAGEVAAKN